VTQAQKDAEARVAARLAQEEKEKEQKKEDDAQKATNEAINSFLLTKLGQARYAPTDEFKKILRLNVEKFRRDEMKWQTIFPVVKTWIADKYREYEDEASKSIGGQR
jgi:hypothetical protein